MKLSKHQKYILELLKNGWQIGHSKGLNSRYWIQENGVGKGGKAIDLKVNTFMILYENKFITKTHEGYPTDKWDISELGKSIL